jgi:pectate lyase
MPQRRQRSSILVSRHPLHFIASAVCLMNLLQGCGSQTSGDIGTPGSSATGGAGATTMPSGGTNAAGGSNSALGGASSGGSLPAAGGGSVGLGGSPGTGGSPGMAGGAAGAGGHPSAGGTTGAGGMTGSGSCSTPPPGSALVGWASQSGMGVTTTTGGGNAAPQTVTTLSALMSAAAGAAAKVIYVTGKLSAGKISIGSNKTIVGLCGAEIHGHLELDGSANVIIRNLTIIGYGVGNCALDPDYDSTVGCSSGTDAVTIVNKAHHIWLDHCDISDGTDGNLDTTNGSDFVTISWTKFHYTSRSDPTGNDSTGAEGHRFSNLIGAADNLSEDVGHLNVTWHHDWWADNVNERMPRTRAGKIHLFNDLFTAKGDSYCTNAGQGASLLVENSVYNGVKAPFQVDSNAVTLLSKGNVFTASTGSETGSGSGFTPPYAYTPDSAANLQAAIQANAGPQ